MARRTQTYAIRLAVEGGGQVKAELISVGQSGEQSLKRIESAGDRASGGLIGIARQAELLRTGIRTLGGALAGVQRSAVSPGSDRHREACANASAAPSCPVRHLPLGLGLLNVAGLQRRHRADRMLRLILDPRHGAPLARRSVRLPAPMERGACALWQCATRHAPLDRHGRGHFLDGVTSHRCSTRLAGASIHPAGAA